MPSTSIREGVIVQDWSVKASIEVGVPAVGGDPRRVPVQYQVRVPSAALSLMAEQTALSEPTLWLFLQE